MNKYFIFLALLLFSSSFAQKNTLKGSTFGTGINRSSDATGTDTISIREVKPPIDLYKIYNLQKDSTYVDTTLTIQSEYKYNLLRKDIFGLLPFSNEGQTYNTLDFGLIKKRTQPTMGFTAKHFNYLESDDINYYSVPTPLTDLYFKTVMEQGQSLDAFLTVNTQENLNFSIAYKGLRSLGKYVNYLTSSGNFRFTSSYFTKDKRYILNAHFTGQDISNQENGGIINTNDFESGDDRFKDRNRIDVYFEDATSMLKGNRFFVDHSFKLSKTNPNSLMFTHQFEYEYKFFEYTQPTVSSRFGTSYSSRISNKTRYNQMYNKVGVAYTTKSYGYLSFFIDDANYNYYYGSVIYGNTGAIEIPNSIADRINMFGGNYTYRIKDILTNITVSQSISEPSISNIEANAKYRLNDAIAFEFNYKKLTSEVSQVSI